MKSYQEFAKHLDQLLGGVCAVRITVPGYMPLLIEEIGSSGDGDRLVSLCHYLPDGVAAEPVSFRNDNLGIAQDVYRYDERCKRTHVVPSMKQDLKEFALAWFVTLRDQGFFAPTAVREILSP